MTDYSKMSDFEINKLVATAIGGRECDRYDDDKSGRHVVFFEINGQPKDVRDGYKSSSQTDFNPCNSWADSGPIISEYKIDIVFGINTPDVDAWSFVDARTEWPKRPESPGKEFEHYEPTANPLRAAMIVFLMMKEHENDS